jgi:AraC-like DNA-binding protein
MVTILDKVAKDFPIALPRDVEMHCSDNFVVFRPNIIVTKPAIFDYYHMVIPSSQLPPLKVGSKIYIPQNDKVFPINPGQPISVLEKKDEHPAAVDHYIAFFIDKEYLQDISRSIYKCSHVDFVNEPAIPGGDILNLIRMFMQESRKAQTGYEFILDCLSTQITINLMRRIKSNLPATDIENKYAERLNISKSIEFLVEHYNDNFSLDELARVANLSPYHFIRVFKSETGKTPYEYLMDLKIEKTKEMLALKQYTITEIGLLCGFANPSHFAVVFRKKTGISPSDYRKSML